MNNGISSKAQKKEQIKSDFESLLRGMNWTGMIDSDAYDYLFDEAMPMFDQMYDLGKKEATTWHPYPKEKPKQSGYYIQKLATEFSGRGVSFFDKELDEFEYNEDYVIAWGEIAYPEQH